MYVPSAFAESDRDRLHAWIRQYAFGVITSSGPNGLTASHLPFLLESDGEHGTLVGHLARANGHWRDWNGETEALVVFQGPHGYVSPAWYATAPSVPTWNYVAVHAYGRPRVIEDPLRLRSILEALVAEHESADAPAWSMTDVPEAYLTGLMRGIVGFELPINRLEGKLKLNQNWEPADRLGVIARLRAAGDAESAALAAAMEATL